MRLAITDNDGTLLDTCTVSAADWRAEVKRNPAGLLALLTPGQAALDADDTPELDDEDEDLDAGPLDSEREREAAWSVYYDRHPEVAANWGQTNGRWPRPEGMPEGYVPRGQV